MGLSNVVDLTAYREERWQQRRAELLLGDLGPAEVAVLETFPEAELEAFFRLRKRVRSEMAAGLVTSNNDKCSPNVPGSPCSRI